VRTRPILFRGRWKFDSGSRIWDEDVDLPLTLRRILESAGRATHEEGEVVVDESTGLRLRPLLAELEPIHEEGVRTATTIEVSHVSQMPVPFFEFQHARGEDVEASVAEGFRGWIESDLPPLTEALGVSSGSCTEVQYEGRRVIFGPVMYHRQREIEGDEPCPCCLFTQSAATFAPLLAQPGVHALRLFASRGGEQGPAADCRCNGEDHAGGKSALLRYVESWPDAGFEFRKQYVIITP
jgi:hypothetical protein